MDGNVADYMPSSAQAMADGIRPDSVVGSPSSSAGGPRPRQKQVPIARSTGSGYERPERARTSHACEPCRERKTKCDGERPSCRRCLHTSTQCHYGYGKGWKKRKTAEDLNVTSSKLARYERLLNDIFPLVSNDVQNMIEDVRQQDLTSSSAEQLDNRPTSSGTFDLEDRRTSPSMQRLPPPGSMTLTQSAPAFMTTPQPLPHSLASDPSQSPILSVSGVRRSSKSPPDDASVSSTIRLPSITRHGFLVEGGAIPGSPSTDAQRNSITGTDADMSRSGMSPTTSSTTGFC